MENRINCHMLLIGQVNEDLEMISEFDNLQVTWDSKDNIFPEYLSVVVSRITEASFSGHHKNRK